MTIVQLQNLAKLIRYYILTMTTTAGSGHATSSLSAVELMTALMFGGFFRSDLSNPQNPNNDRLIFSKGHASPLFYALYAAAGKLTLDELLKYRKFESPLEGHPTLEFPYTEAPTGSLGQGLSIGLGMALALRAQFRVAESGKRKAERKGITLPFTLHASRFFPSVFVLLGDGEMAEGSVWEAIQAATFQKVDNLVAILDVNRLGQSQPTMFEHHLEEYKKRFEAFGWKTIIVQNGHDLKGVITAFQKISRHSGKRGTSESRIDSGQARMTEKPTVIIAKTFKGAGVKLLQNKDNWHGKPLPKDLYEQAIKELGEVDLGIKGEVRKPEFRIQNSEFRIKNKPTTHNPQPTTYHLGDSIATRQAAGDAVTQLMYKYPQVVVLDGDVKNSLYTESTQAKHPDRYFEFFIAEQNMVGVATGMSRRGLIPFMTTFSAFMTRGYDQIRMAALARANTKFIGSHAGVSIGEDGASQMGLEDLSMFRSIFGSTVLCPADAVSTQKLVEEMIKTPGINYIRVARPATAVIYGNDEKFPIGGSKIHRLSSRAQSRDLSRMRVRNSNKLRDSSVTPQNDSNNKIMIIAAGITLYESLKAQETLAKEGFETIVVDCYSIKPIDSATLLKLSSKFSTILTVEDHWFEGGLGDAVLNVFASPSKPWRSGAAKKEVKIYKLAVTKLPHSGKPQELLDFEEISTNAIIRKVKSIL